jgi:hypothetical protein
MFNEYFLLSPTEKLAEGVQILPPSNHVEKMKETAKNILTSLKEDSGISKKLVSSLKYAPIENRTEKMKEDTKNIMTALKEDSRISEKAVPSLKYAPLTQRVETAAVQKPISEEINLATKFTKLLSKVK